VTIELHGIALHGFHGVLEHERREGQRFLVDVDLDLSDETAATTDRIEDAVDYREVVAAVAAVSEARAYHLLEAFATAIAETLVARFPVTRVRVRVRKPDVVLTRPVDHAAVVVERRRS
jgi:dihydroneopterin aldolase